MTSKTNFDEKKTAIVTGAGGLLGGCMTEQLAKSNWRVIALTHADLDITDETNVRRIIEQEKPDVVINCAATTDVDRCERDIEWAFAVNQKGPRYLARACRDVHAEFVHISTDYVFDGTKPGFYTQEDSPNPLSVYGKSKLAGEQAVSQELPESLIIRTSWVFGVGGKNFGSKLFDYARAGAKLKGVQDQTSIATYAPDLAARIEELMALRHHGLYHVTNTGAMSWLEFARLAFELAGMRDFAIEPCTRADLNQLALRPHNSAMRCLLSESLGLKPLRSWQAALKDFVRNYFHQP
ncbi:MAG: dTDP-4-dehydrorhamnose reductase [Acidobacteriota bacterium]